MITSKVFWKDILDNYCEISHFHGFHELKMSNSWRGKFFWLLMIGFAFSFTIFLIVLLCQDYLSEPVVTSVSREKYGKLSLPVLYCPADWIDSKTAEQLNISDYNLLYSLSYLKNGPEVYRHFPFKDVIAQVIRNSSKSYCEVIENDIYFHFALPAIIETFLDQHQLPDYFGLYSRKLINNLNGTGLLLNLIQNSTAPNAVQSWKLVQELYVNKSAEALFQFLYYKLSSKSMRDVVIENLFTGNETEFSDLLTSNPMECNRPFSLYSVDVMFQQKKPNCTAQLEKVKSPKIGLDTEELCAKIVQEVGIFALFSGKSWFTMWKNNHVYKEMAIDGRHRKIYDGELGRRDAIEIRKLNRMVDLMASKNTIYGKYLIQNSLSHNEENFRNFLSQTNTTVQSQNEVLLKLYNDSFQAFLDEEEQQFKKFLHDHQYQSPMDVWLDVSIDASQLLLSLSVSGDIAVRPKVGNITVTKTVKADGVCFRLGIFADTKAFDSSIMKESSRDVGQNLDQQEAVIRQGIFSGRLKEKLFANIALMHWDGGFFFKGSGNRIVIGNDTDDFYSTSYNTFDIFYDPDNWWQTYYHFEVSTMTYQWSVNREDSPCEDDEYRDNGIKNSYINCIMDCDNRNSMPKYYSLAETLKFADCAYIAESMEPTTIKNPCSVFAFRKSSFDFNLTSNYVDDKLTSCVEDCTPYCVSLSFNLRNSSLNCSYPDCVPRENQLLTVKDPPKNNPTFFTDLYENVPDGNASMNGNGPIWQTNYNSKTKSNIARTITFFAAIKDIPRTRIEIEIQSDTTKYMEKFTFSWYGFLGVIGGQVGLVMSGSILTLAQISWWCSIMFLKSYHTASAKRFAEHAQHGSIVEANQGPTMMKLKRIFSTKGPHPVSRTGSSAPNGVDNAVKNA